MVLAKISNLLHSHSVVSCRRRPHVSLASLVALKNPITTLCRRMPCLGRINAIHRLLCSSRRRTSWKGAFIEQQWRWAVIVPTQKTEGRMRSTWYHNHPHKVEGNGKRFSVRWVGGVLYGGYNGSRMRWYPLGRNVMITVAVSFILWLHGSQVWISGKWLQSHRVTR